MKKTVAIYALSLALLAFALKAIEYQLLIKDASTEIFVTIVAIGFLIFGVWLGRKLTTPSLPTNSHEINHAAIAHLQLSDRELEVLQEAATGKSNQQIAESLFLSIHTVKTHLSNVYEKLEVKRRTEAIMKAKELNIIS
ncbi:response regulator transcription factor [Balneola vulgaris]|uniref:response regulator transcription factor n=1 Tax=Balneola vulgaris TaxID=287535 RepID=UPI0003626E95|nr:response regulator transcription factor [Balneola vulgaris]